MGSTRTLTLQALVLTVMLLIQNVLGHSISFNDGSKISGKNFFSSDALNSKPVLISGHVKGGGMYFIRNANPPAIQTCNCTGDNYVTLDNGQRNWEDAGTWIPKWQGQNLPPSTSGANDRICIRGTVVVNGNLTLNSDPTICDTLIVRGNLSVSAYSMALSQTGVIIVLGDYIGGSGSTSFNGNMVVQGSFSSGYSNTLYGQGGLYVDGGPVNYQTGAGSPPAQNMDSLKLKNPSLYDLYQEVKCGLTSGDTPGQISLPNGSPTCFYGSPLTINNQVSPSISSNTAPYSYSWQIQINSQATWINSPALGQADTATLTTMDVSDGASTISAIRLKVRRVVTYNTCELTSNYVEFFRGIVTGAAFHISNNTP